MNKPDFNSILWYAIDSSIDLETSMSGYPYIKDLDSNEFVKQLNLHGIYLTFMTKEVNDEKRNS